MRSQFSLSRFELNIKQHLTRDAVSLVLNQNRGGAARGGPLTSLSDQHTKARDDVWACLCVLCVACRLRGGKKKASGQHGTVGRHVNNRAAG